MTRLRRGVSALVALGLVACALPAQAKVKHPRTPVHRHAAAPVAESFPVYLDHGADRSPGTDNHYFSDTKVPNYIVGPGYFQRWDCGSTYIVGSGSCM